MKNVYSYAEPILVQKKDFRMVHDDIREEYLQSFFSIPDFVGWWLM